MSNTIHSNLLDSIDDYIVHQTNCVTSYPKGLSFSIFKKYPYANVYGSSSRIPGTIQIKGKELLLEYYISLQII